MIQVTEHQNAISKSIIENPRFVTTSTLNHPVHCMIHWSPLECAVPSFPCMSGHPPRSRFRTRRSGKSSRRRCSTWHFRRDSHPKYGQMIAQNLRYLKWMRETQPPKQPYKGNPTSILGTRNFLWNETGSISSDIEYIAMWKPQQYHIWFWRTILLSHQFIWKRNDFCQVIG